MIESWDAGAYRDVREIWELIQAGDDKFKRELIRGLNALTGHLEYDIGQIRSALSILSELSSLIERGKRWHELIQKTLPVIRYGHRFADATPPRRS